MKERRQTYKPMKKLMRLQLSMQNKPLVQRLVPMLLLIL
jgi:hypothetical protein